MMSIAEQDEMNRRRRLQQQQDMAGIVRGMISQAKANEVKPQLMDMPEEDNVPSEANPNADIIAEHGYGGNSVGGDASAPMNPGQGQVPLEQNLKQPKMDVPQGVVDRGMLEELMKRFKGG
jgi:hypothetical protein